MNISPQLEAARRRRDEIMAQARWLDEAGVQRAGMSLLRVYDGYANLYRFPAFQVGAEGKRISQLSALLELLPSDGSGWPQMFWLYQPHARLDGRAPVDVFASDPGAVLVAARSTFAPGDTNW